MMLIQYVLPVALLHFMPVIGENSVCRTLEPLGMESGIIGDDQLTASEYWGNYDIYSPKQARLRNDYYWSTDYGPTDPWIQVDFLDMGKEVVVTGIQTQGGPPSWKYPSWVKTLKIQTGYSESNMTYIMDGDKPKIFGANSDANAIVNITFPTPVSARYLHIKPIDWYRKDYGPVALRFEVLGCYETEIKLFGKHTSQSSTYEDKMADRAVDGKAWHNSSCTHTEQDEHAWWMVDMEEPQYVSRIVIYIRVDDCCRNRSKGAIIRVGNDGTNVNTNSVFGNVTIIEDIIRLTPDVPCGLRGRYISVHLQDTDYLEICELKAFNGDCTTTKWSSWGAWGSCSKTCGDGTKTRSRNCPETGECSGSSTNSTSCSIQICESQTNVGSISIAVIVVIVSGVTVLLAVLITIIIFFKKKHGGRNRKQTRSQSITHTYFDNRSFHPDTVGHEDNQDNSDTLEYEDPDEDEPEYEDVGSSEWDIAWEDLNLSGKILGKGNFGDVQLAQVKIRGKWIKAAVKTLKDDTPESERALFRDEFDTMTKIGHHPNVVNILGSCEHAGSFYVVLEYVHHGNLRKFLRKCRKEAKQISQRGLRSTVTFDLSPEQLLHFAIGVSKAMMHIADCGIIHRDLAARNILVARGFIPKVSDFGMSREEDVYTQTSSRRVPTRWLAIESLTKKMYSTQSDVWSFGILLWEIATFGGTPYSGMETRRLARHLTAGYRMPKPKNCEDDMYRLMLQCWQEDPNARPTFKDIVTILSNMAEQDKIYMSTHVYENFKYAAIRLDRDDR